MSEISHTQNAPRSIRQKRILSIAAENPDASLEQIASEVATATPDVVEKVLEEFGDPAEQGATAGQYTGKTATSDGGIPASERESQSGKDVVEEQAVSLQTTDDKQAETNRTTNSKLSASLPAFETLTPKQRETLKAIQANPEATQRELADILDVSAPTVSNRVNAIPEFDWENRLSFVNAVLDANDSAATEEFETTVAPWEESGSEDGTETIKRDSSIDPAEAFTEGESDTNDGEIASEPAESTDKTVNPESDEVEASLDIESGQAERLIQCINDLQARLEGSESTIDTENTDSNENPFEDPELAHKIVHACMETEKISEDEELKILKHLL